MEQNAWSNESLSYYKNVLHSDHGSPPICVQWCSMAIIRLIIRFDSIEINYDTALCSLPLTHACFLLFFIAFYLGIFRLFFLVLHVYRTSIFNMGGQHLMSYCLHWQPAMYIFYSYFCTAILWQINMMLMMTTASVPERFSEISAHGYSSAVLELCLVHQFGLSCSDCWVPTIDLSAVLLLMYCIWCTHRSFGIANDSSFLCAAA